LLPSLFPGGFSLSSSKELFLAYSSRSQAQIIRWLACSALKAYTAGLGYLGTTALKIRTDFASEKVLLRLVDASAKMLRGFMKQVIFNTIKKKKDRFPELLTIEFSSICNAKYIMCPHSEMERVKENMPFEILRSIGRLLPTRWMLTNTTLGWEPSRI
jgi:hypothetical protein